MTKAADSENEIIEMIGGIITSNLRQLSPRGRAVLLLRSGLMDGRRRTYEQVARELGRTRERIRQLEKRALLKLTTSGDCREDDGSLVAIILGEERAGSAITWSDPKE